MQGSRLCGSVLFGLPTRKLSEGGAAVRRGHLVPIFRNLWLAGLAWLLVAAPVRGADEIAVVVTYLAREEAPLQPLSLAEPILTDAGLMGARQALEDNKTTGAFLGHQYQLVERIVPEDGDLGAVFDEAL